MNLERVLVNGNGECRSGCRELVWLEKYKVVLNEASIN